jgi:hypothetical protein
MTGKIRRASRFQAVGAAETWRCNGFKPARWMFQYIRFGGLKPLSLKQSIRFNLHARQSCDHDGIVGATDRIASTSRLHLADGP